MDLTGRVFVPPIQSLRARLPWAGMTSQSLSAAVRADRNITRAVWMAALITGALAALLRAVNLAHAFDVYSDEIIYSQLSASVAHSLTLNFQGDPAFVHPPMLFLIEGGYLRLFFQNATTVQLVLDSRWLNVAFAGMSAALLFAIAHRVAGWWAGLAAALIFSLDPFMIAMSSRNLLQPSALFWVLAGYAALLTAAGGKPGVRRACVAGLAFGAALLTEEETAFHTLLPLAACFALNWSIPRRVALLIGAIPFAMYAALVACVVAAGGWSNFSQAKVDGIGRLFGVLHVSGFGSPSPTGRANPGPVSGHAVSPATPAAAATPSFVHALLADLAQYATTYALIALGAVAVVYLLLRHDGAVRLLAVWTVCAYVLQTYSIKFGTNEAQYYYYLVAPTLLADVTAATLLLRSGCLPSMALRWAPVATSLCMLGFVVWAGYNWVDRHTTPDNGFQRLFVYMQAHVPAGSRIAATNLPANRLLHGLDYQDDYWGSVQQLEQYHEQYAIVSSALTFNGYDAGTPALYRWLQTHGRRLFAFKDPTYGVLALYRLPQTYQAPRSAVALSDSAPGHRR